MVDITQLAENFYQIDDRLYGIAHWGSVYLLDEDRKALIDTGPETSAKVVIEGIKKCGVKPEDIDYLVATHIHLDHAGGAGSLLKEMPRAQVVVHPRGARHLADPSRLIAGAIAALGPRAMELDGEPVPIPSGRLKSVTDNEELRLSDRQVLRFIDAPGHAPHELCIYETRHRSLFTGDAAGVFIPAGHILFPTCQLPNFNLEEYLKTLDRLGKYDAVRFCYAHFGTSTTPGEDLDIVKAKLRVWGEIAARADKEGKPEEIAARIEAHSLKEASAVEKIDPQVYQHLRERYFTSAVAGFVKYYHEKQNVKTEAQ